MHMKCIIGVELLWGLDYLLCHLLETKEPERMSCVSIFTLPCLSLPSWLFYVLDSSDTDCEPLTSVQRLLGSWECGCCTCWSATTEAHEELLRSWRNDGCQAPFFLIITTLSSRDKELAEVATSCGKAIMCPS